MSGQRESKTTISPTLGDDARAAPSRPSTIAEYLLGEQVAAGGMGAVHVGLKVGALGFRRLVAIKRLHAHLVQDAEFVARFKDEIRLVSRLTHPNVVQTLDVVDVMGELALIMEFVDGVTLYELLTDARESGAPLPISAAVGIMTQALHGLHAAHEAMDDAGRPLQLVHRDVSPQNIMISRVGLVKVLDFGIAKATSETHVTRTGQLSGKAAYMSPEQVSARTVDRRTDVFAAGVVLWEVLTGERLFRGAGVTETAALMNILEKRVEPPSKYRSGVSAELDRVVLRALERDPARRFGSARDFALSLEQAVDAATSSDVAGSVLDLCAQRLARGAATLERFREGLGRIGSSADSELDSSAVPTRLNPVVVVPSAGLLSPDLGTPLPPHASDDAQTVDVQGVLVDESTRVSALSPRSARFAFALISLAVALLVGRAVLAPHASVAPVPPQAADPPRTLPPQPSPAKSTVAAVTSASRSEEPEAHPPPLDLSMLPPLRQRPEVRRSPRPSDATKRPAAVPARSERPRPPVSKAADPCSPPTYTDADGIRHYKRECL